MSLINSDIYIYIYIYVYIYIEYFSGQVCVYVSCVYRKMKLDTTF